MLMRLEVFDGAAPVAGGPDGEVQAGLRPALVDDWCTVDAGQGGAQLLGDLAAESGFGGLARLDVAAGKVPDVGVPAAARGAVTEQDLVGAAQDHGNDLMGQRRVAHRVYPCGVCGWRAT